MDPHDFGSFPISYDETLFDPNAFLSLPQGFDQLPTPSSTSLPRFSSIGSTPSSLEPPQDATSKLKNCAACRMRRVKCEREPGQTSCKKCIAKGLVCTQLPTKPRKTPVRTGKRIESAQALFGQTQSPQGNETLGIAAPPAKRRREERSTSVLSELSPTSVVAALVTGELEASLTGSLLELYDTMPHDGRIPLFQATVFRPMFESNGRRLDCLDPRIEPLAAVVLALAARVSDHPLLVGASAPTASALSKAIRDGDDLSDWGKRRTDACQALLDRAVKVADEKGVWRIPSAENFATLMMIEGMTDYETAYDPRNTHPTRSIGAAYMLHLRAILLGSDTETRERVMSSGVGWTAFCRDSILNATTGSTSVFSDDDCFLLSDNMPIPLDKALAWPEIDPRSPDDPYNCPFWIPFNSIMYTIAQLGRAASVKLTGIRATRNPRIDEEFVRYYISTLGKLKSGFNVLAPRLERYLGPEELASSEAKPVYGFVKHLRATKAGLAFLLDRVLRQRKSTRDETIATEAAKIFQLEEYGPLGGPDKDEDQEYWERFEILSNEANEVAFEAGRELVAIFRAQESLSLGAVSGMQMLFIRLPMWVSRLIDAPTVEEGGSRPEWTYETKLSDLRTILRAVHGIGWSYGSYSKPAPWLRAIISRIEAKQRYHLVATGADTALFAPLSEPNPLLPSSDSSTSTAPPFPFPFSPAVDSSCFSPNPDLPSPPQYGDFSSGLPWSDENFNFDIPVSGDSDWEALLQSIVGESTGADSLAASSSTGTEEKNDKDEKVLVDMFQTLLS